MQTKELQEVPEYQLFPRIDPTRLVHEDKIYTFNVPSIGTFYKSKT
jgi:hypothetical protein